MKTSNVVKLTAVIVVAVLIAPQLLDGIHAMKKWWEIPSVQDNVESENSTSKKTDADKLILPGETKRFPTYRREFTFESSGREWMRGVTIENGIERTQPLRECDGKWTIPRHSNEGINQIPNLWKITDYLEVYVPKDHPPSSFEVFVQ